MPEAAFLNVGSRAGKIVQWVKPLMVGCETGFQISSSH